MAGLRPKIILRIGTIEQRVQAVSGLKCFMAFLRSTMESTAGEAKKMMRIELVLRYEEIRSVIGILGLVETGPRVRVEARVESSAGEG